jgi:hypothetical protein
MPAGTSNTQLGIYAAGYGGRALEWLEMRHAAFSFLTSAWHYNVEPPLGIPGGGPKAWLLILKSIE